MEKKEILQAIKQARENSKKRNFEQSLDIIINLKNINIKKEDEKINTFFSLPHAIREKVNVTALISKELSTKAKSVCTEIVLDENFKSQDKKSIKKLAAKTDFFIAQANIMPKIAATFGRVLGPRGLMPNPKTGGIVPPTGEIAPVVEKLKSMIKLETKNEATIKASAGKESMKDEDLADNFLAIYNTVLHQVPKEKNNIKNVLIKFTMSSSFEVGKETTKTKEKNIKKETKSKQKKEAKK